MIASPSGIGAGTSRIDSAGVPNNEQEENIMQCPNCGGEELHSSVTVYHDYVQQNGEWQFIGPDRPDKAQIACTSCGHEWTENQDIFVFQDPGSIYCIGIDPAEKGADITLSSDEPITEGT